MSKGINKAMIIGRVGQDPVRHTTGNGTSVCSISLATNDYWKNAEGEPQERVEWHRVAFYGRLADVVSEYVTKGMQIYVEGRIETQKWQDKEGHERTTTQIVAMQMQMLDKKESQPKQDVSYDEDLPF